MFSLLSHAWNRRCLKDLSWRFLFGPEHPDEVVCFDCETTGLDREKDDIISLAAVRIRGNRILTSRSLELFIRPGRAINRDAIRIHHLRETDVAGGFAPQEAMARFLHFIGTRPLVGYYLEFDIALVNRLLKPWLGIRLPNRRIEVSSLYYDREIARHDPLWRGHVDLRFDTMMQTLDLPRLKAHNALDDAVMTALMYVKLHSKPVRKHGERS
ncbi:3'-5' exonuclease [Haematospirillum jordaniae]|uniref:DNA polymerase III subunit epsilon n=1 Tax=Haematospirillum jordaniae TaxID=1549855 RepID=A0A143DD31_9PROT|nr:3'-5' exonuclease [Haematospirillum jordaniae]AMW34644.1 DNA polymerase III subunit epsilon [Haematospirillum jordaniae]NKD44827.1 3'-5' exonuclease [Haematospirillum jordaniae]NKD57018.1 3'-5' exonuclease [Haematospirillum jordaniae]NKD58826.1 3'-5' exonuclease [Haematospirillum jordaniae]NKD66943.1 3'-5' exonuclease [Haematospirillum jordaniae]